MYILYFEKTSVVKAVAWSAIDKWGAQGLSFLVLWILARLLGPEPFGLIAIASVFTRFVEIFLDQGMTEAIIREPTLAVEHLNTAFWINLAWSLFLVILTLLTADFIANLYKEVRLSAILQWLSIGFFLSALSSTQVSYLRRQLKFKYLALRSILSKFIAAGVAILFAVFGYGVWSLVAQLLVGNFISMLILWSASDWHPKLQFSKDHFRDLFRISIRITGTRISEFANAQLPDILIGYYMDAVSLGYFSVSHTFTKRLVSVIRNVILDVAYPAFSREQNQKERLRSLFDIASKFTALIIFPIFTYILLAAPELVIVLFGPEWDKAEVLVRILAAMGGVYALIAYFSQMLMAIGQVQLLLKLKLATLAMNALGLLISIKYGLTAVTGVYVITWYLVTPLYYYYVHKSIGLKGYLRNFQEIIISIVVMVVVVSIAQMVFTHLLPMLLSLGILSLLGFLSYGISMWILDPESINKIVSIANIVFSRQKFKQYVSEERLR